jgi:hypothetical protein
VYDLMNDKRGMSDSKVAAEDVFRRSGKLDYMFGKKGAEQLRAINDLAKDIYTAPPGAVNHSNTASVILAALDMATSGIAGMPLPVMSGLRILTTHVRDRKIQHRINDALGIKPEPKKVKAPQSRAHQPHRSLRKRMTAQAIVNPLPTFTGLDGLPLSGGYIYFGAENADPRTSPVAVYYDASLTIPVTQPARTTVGYLYRNGAPTSMYANSAFSLLVLDARKRQVLYVPSVQGFSLSALVYIASGSGAIARDPQEKMREQVSVFDFMTAAQKSDTTARTQALDATAAVQKAIDSGAQRLLFPSGAYKITSSLKVPNSGTAFGMKWIGEGLGGPGNGTELYYTASDGTPMVTQANTGTTSSMPAFSAENMSMNGPGVAAAGGGSCFSFQSATNAFCLDRVMVRQFPGSAFKFARNGGADNTAVQNALFNEVFVNSVGGYVFDADGRVNATFVQPDFNKCSGAFRCQNGEGPGKTQLLVLGLWWEGDLGGTDPCLFTSNAQLSATFVNCQWDGPNATGNTIFTVTGVNGTNIGIVNNGQNGFLTWINDSNSTLTDPFILPSPSGRAGGVMAFSQDPAAKNLLLNTRRPSITLLDNDSSRSDAFRSSQLKHQVDKLFVLRVNADGSTDNLAEFFMNGLHFVGHGQGRFDGGLGVGNSAVATTAVGALVKKMQVFDAAGASLGFIPIYSSIT